MIGAFDPATKTGVVPLNHARRTVSPSDRTPICCWGALPPNNPTNTTTLAINATTKNFANIGGITGSDEVWFDAGDNRFYTGSNRQPGGAVLGVISDANLLIETIPQSSASHSVAADSTRNRIFVPQAAPVSVVGPGGDTTAVGAGICGGTTGCVAVYSHDVRNDPDDNQ